MLTTPHATDSHHFIFTADSDSAHVALAELEATLDGFNMVEWLNDGVGLAYSSLPYCDVSGRLNQSLCAFTRHICPVDEVIGCSEIGGAGHGKPELVRFLQLEDAVRSMLPRFDERESFSVQTRVFDNEVSPYDINNSLSDIVLNSGNTLDVRHPNQVLSVVVRASKCYLGLSRATDNLSSWAGGKRRFSRDETRISRAEFKLLEAIEAFSIALPACGCAMDLGAAPGGWTRVLREAGLTVVAVDPARLHSSLEADCGVSHVRMLAQDYLRACSKENLSGQTAFDVVTNDMRMDVRDSARLMAELATIMPLSPNARVIMTLKLPQHDQQKMMRHAIAILEKAYQITGLRQLFHNRSEVTAVLLPNSNTARY